MTNNDNEKIYSDIISYLSKYNIQIPPRISSALKDMLDENDFIYSDDVIHIYFKEDLESFEAETECANILYFDISENNNSSFDIISKYTYYGNLIINNSYAEDLKIINNDQEVYNISEIVPNNLNKLENPNDYCLIVLVERLFENKEYSEIPRIYFYVPEEISKELPENTKENKENTEKSKENTKNIDWGNMLNYLNS